MITVTIEKRRIKASGHAGTAPKGQYLVCAAFYHVMPFLNLKL